ncbi:unnamed protein product, partial [Rotaria sp. Silwood1]
MELKAFAYRCFYSKKFHLLIRPELLTVSIQDKFIELLLQIINLDSGRRFQFGVITSSDEKNQPLINSLRTLELLHPIYDHQMLNKHDLKKETEKFLGKNCYLVTSSMAGLGKSTLIRNRIQESGKQYLKFPISGHIDLETLVGRLRTFESVRKNQRSASDGIIQLDEAIIRWDKLQPFTVIFTEWNDPLFVYKNINDVPRSLIDTVVAPVQANIFYRVLFSSRLKHEQQQREQAQFPDHNQLKHEDFFMRLAALSKKYYSKPVCNSCFKQYEDTDQTCASCGNKSQLLRPKTAEELDIKDFQMKIANQLEKEYVWTADNYIKALLIYLRIQCRLPVILIGETGSKNCTSESVLKVFERAEKYLGVETSSNILPVIVFDEIGLAELSTHNPLKVLHSKLEIETCKYGFVGISNWHLDAAKMNRALYLACPDPDKDELKLTAETISSSLLKDRTKNTAIDDSV